MRRIVGLVLMTALVAPALAVCAGGMMPARPASEHDCCPKAPASIMAAPSGPTASAACCRMSADAAQRGAIQAVPVSLSVTPVGALVAWLTPAPARLPGHTEGPAESPHIARHLLLSVLLI
jgi:hypothetical protein